jgi:hypothetical protein
MLQVILVQSRQFFEAVSKACEAAVLFFAISLSIFFSSATSLLLALVLQVQFFDMSVEVAAKFTEEIANIQLPAISVISFILIPLKYEN